MDNQVQITNLIEQDMIKKTYEESEKLSSKVFKVYPLIGEYQPKEKTIQKWFDVTRQYVEKRLESKSTKYHYWVYEQVTLVIVHFAKTWNSSDEGRFSKYIAMKLGYRDDSGKIWSLLTDAIEQAFKQHNRLFITRNNERQFFETIMVHSFGPEGSWLPLIDLLFSFYSENLSWTYVPNDPLFRNLVKVLQNYFNNAETDEDQFQIASHKYNLRVGIRRLVQERPEYSAYLFELLVKRIQKLLRNEASDAKRYSYSIVDKWFSDKINKSVSITEKHRIATKEHVELALDYSKVNIRYAISEGKLAMRIPAIRIIGDEQGTATAEFFEADRLIDTYALSVVGNELGETIQGKTVVIPTGSSEGHEMKYRVIIKRGNSIIHDSEKNLYRQVVFFSEGKEQSAKKLRKEKYDIFIPDYRKVRIENADITNLPHGLYEIALHSGYVLEYAGNIIAIDSESIEGARIVSPQTDNHVRFLKAGNEYKVLGKESSIKFYIDNNTNLSKYVAVINGNRHPMTDFFDSTAENRAIMPVKESSEITVIDISANTIIYNDSYFFIPDFDYSFDRNSYYSDEEFENLSLSIKYNGQAIKVGTNNRTEVSLEYEDGLIVIDIPYIKTEFEGVGTVFFNKYIHAENIEENSILAITNKTGLPHSLTIDGDELGNVDSLELFSYAHDEKNNGKDIVLTIDNVDHYLGRIVYGNTFIQSPKISLVDNALLWDGGIAYIGDANAEMGLSIAKDGKEIDYFDLHLGEPNICQLSEGELDDDYYEWIIYVNNESIHKGYSFFGDKRKARFSGKYVQIDFVTEDIEGSSSAVPIKTVYIDQIEYTDTCFVETEDDIYDVYSGRMYWIDWNGEKRYYSFKYSEDGSRYKINPVKIIYVSDKFLRIVNEDNEGIYYYYKDIPPNIGNEITDREPSAKARNYHDILFYMYEIKSVEKPSSKAMIDTEESIEQRAETKNAIVNAKKEETMVAPEQNPQDEWGTGSLSDLQVVSQQKVIEAPVEKRLLVNAGPGTGKTWTLIERVIYLVSTGIDPESIQVLCFSRAAVEVVRKRMASAIAEERVDSSVNKVDVRTFDSFASQLLYWVKDSDYGIIPDNYRIESLDYEQRIELFTRVLKSHPELIEQCEHLIVDEVQDLVQIRAQMVVNMINSLPEESGVTLFGDACQAIYDYQVEEGMSSEDFYDEIEKSGLFEYCAFDYNYRQTTAMEELCEDYRLAILSGNVNDCNEELSEIDDYLPDYTIADMNDFEEDTLKSLLEKGKVGILTRSNAQALYISRLFHKKGIEHTLQRRLADNYLGGWIAVLFNQLSTSLYDEQGFADLFDSMFPDENSRIASKDLWQTVIGDKRNYTNSSTAANMLRGIKEHGKNAGLYTEIPDSDVTISTVHRSKGREYDSVIILNDMIEEKSDIPEEHRVKYVALSRAKQRVYKVNLKSIYFSTLEDRRCYTMGKNFGTGGKYLRFFEVGKNGDFDEYSFCSTQGVQEYIRSCYHTLKGKEVYLKKIPDKGADTPTYSIVLKENGMVLGKTSAQFGKALEKAIKKIQHLPWNASVYNYLYPARLNGIYITDVASEIRMPLGRELGVREFGNLTTWNIVLAEGYAKAEYIRED